MKIEVTAIGPKPFDDTTEIIIPHSAGPFIENQLLNRLDRRPVRLEVAQPVFSRTLIVPAQFLNIENMQTVVVQQLQRGAGWDTAARKHLFDRQEFGGEWVDIASGRDQADAARLQRGRDTLDPA